MRVASLFTSFIIAFLFLTASACKKKDTSVVITVRGDTSFVSCPAIIVGGAAWKDKIGRSDIAANSDFKNELALLHQTFPNDSSMIAMVKTHHFAVEGGSEIFSFDTLNHYIFLASQDRKVTKISSVSEDMSRIAANLGSEPVIPQKPMKPAQEEVVTTKEEGKVEEKIKIDEEKMRQISDSVAKNGPQSVPVQRY